MDVGDPIYLPHNPQLSQQAMGQVTILTNSQQAIPLGNMSWMSPKTKIP